MTEAPWVNKGSYVEECPPGLPVGELGRGGLRARRYSTSESESHHAAKKTALSKGRWGTGARHRKPLYEPKHKLRARALVASCREDTMGWTDVPPSYLLLQHACVPCRCSDPLLTVHSARDWKDSLQLFALSLYGKRVLLHSLKLFPPAV